MIENKLTTKNVERVLKDCLFREDEDISNRIEAEGIISTFGFHPERLNAHKDEIKSMLSELPDNFMQSKGGGWSFLNACVDKHGNHWGEHRNIEQLLCLGIASGMAKIQFPREFWGSLPGGMPYFSVND